MGLLAGDTEQVPVVLFRPRRVEHAVGDWDRLLEHPLDHSLVGGVGLDRVGEEAHAEGDVAMLVAGDVGEALDEAGQGALALVVVDDEVLAGEGEPEQVMATRGLALVRDDSLIQAAVDEALAASPDIAEKIRGGKVAAAGAIVGAVMKATRGQADAGRVRELLLERLDVTE